MRGPWRATVLGSQVAELLRRPGRFAATGLSLLIAAFVVFGAVMAQQIVAATVVDRFRGTPDAVTLVVTGKDAADIGGAGPDAIRSAPGVAEAVGRVEGGAPVGGSAADRYLALAADPGTGPLARVRTVEGAYPSGPRQLAVDTRAAEAYGLGPGSSLTLLLPTPDGESTRRVPVEITGVVRPAATSTGEPTGYAPGPGLLRLLGLPGYSRVDVRTETPAAATGAAERIRRAVPGAVVRSGDEVRDEEARAAVADASDTLELAGVFLAVAVGAAVLVATSTFRIVFARRVRQLALLRAVGATSRRLAAALVAEGAVVGLLAGAAGVLAAWSCARLVPPVAGRFGHGLSAPAGFPLPQAALTVLGTGLLAVLAVLAPSLTASRVSPLQALRTATSEESTVNGTGRTVLGVLCAAGAVLLARQQYAGLPEPGDTAYDRFAVLTLVVVSGGLAFLALIALGPLLVRPVLSALAVPLRRTGAAGRLAVAGVGGAPGRAASVSVVVALGVCLVGSTLTCLASLDSYERYKRTLEAPADFRLYAGEGGTLDRTIAADLAARPELAGVTAFRTAEVTEDGRSATVSDLDLTTVRSGTGLTARTGALGELGPARVVVDAEHAHRLGVEAGDRVTLTSGDRPVRLTVAATLPGAGPHGVNFFVTPADLTRLGAGPAPTLITANAATDGAEGRARAHRAVTQILTGPERGDGRVVAEDAATRTGADDDLRTMATTVVLLLGLTVLVAVAGVATTASLTVVERRREFGLLRALGLGGAAVHRMVTLECALYGVLGGILGLALGLPYSYLTVRAAEVSAPFTVPAGQLAAVVAALVLVTAAAGTVPALRASRTPPTVAVARGD
ncbi:FtsX-like permease family protein [Streptomyces sp. GESEQ-13]|uniref:FtsX-like permease family protein n=1 Tax=Streptomyces sp. GESEQ-13 TaxID=2812654 RepID=UPI001B338B94